ncbi:MAG: hypothetical protein WAM81_09335, partial [Acidimicrobiia bacterium]
LGDDRHLAGLDDCGHGLHVLASVLEQISDPLSEIRTSEKRRRSGMPHSARARVVTSELLYR